MAENFPKLMLDIKPQIEEVQRTQSKINTPFHTHTPLRHIINMLKLETKDRENLESSQSGEEGTLPIMNKNKKATQLLAYNWIK